MATEVSAGAGADSSGCVGDGADVGGGVVTKTFVATGLTIVRDSLSTVCAPDVAFRRWAQSPIGGGILDTRDRGYW